MIGSIVSYVGGSIKLTSLRAYSSYEDFVILLEGTSKIYREDCKLYNFVHDYACIISSVQDFTVMINMHKTNPGIPFHIWIVNELRVHSQNSQNFIFDFCSSGKRLSTTKDIGSGKGLSTTKAGGPLHHNSFPNSEPEYKGYPETNGRGLDLRRFRPLVDDDDNVPQSNESFKTICTDVPPSNKPSIPQSNVHISNEPVLTNVPQSNEYFQTISTDVPLSTGLRFESQPEQVKDLVDFLFKSVAFTEDPYDFSKVFNIGDLYRDRIELKNYIRAYAVIKKFNIKHVLSSEYKIVVRCKGHKCSWQIYATRYGVAYTNHVESWNNIILKVRDLLIHVFIEELRRICSEMSCTYMEEAEKSQVHLTPWATDHCESRKFVADSLTCRVRTSRHHFQMTSYGKTDSINIEDGTCSCRWWQAMGIPCEHGVRALGLANIDPTTHVSEYFINDTCKAVYEAIWILIRGIEQRKFLKTDPRVHAPIPIVRAGRPRTQRKRREKIPSLVTKLRFCSRCKKKRTQSSFL
ncbi:hypothetical protein GIB67_027349 [Kingdonia uniflora]|uniref:SWIM-type domain-containing protein n=1 Tax=Kingdonia uniflora TaxID=39325 RepID=A0A7J7MF93_9MAGN|nr:hypothetical protein GIB67_027349 [Kingdonia uniflora]